MAKIKTVHDMVLEKMVTWGELKEVAENLFDGDLYLVTDDLKGFEGYNVTIPKFSELPDHIQQFIIKSLIFGEAKHILDKEPVDMCDAQGEDEPDPEIGVFAEAVDEED